MKRYFKRYLDGKRRRPSLLVSAAHLRETAQKLFGEGDTLLACAYERVAADACPRISAVAQDRNGEAVRALNAAYLSALLQAAGHSAEASTYAQCARAALVAFAKTGVPEYHSGLGFLLHNYLIALAFAYDLAWDAAGWTPEERESLRTMFYGRMDELRDQIYRKHLSNHAAWSQARVATTALLFRDEQLAAECFDGPDSYAARLAHAFFDDGLSYEQSLWQYHVYTVLPMTIMALAARAAGGEPDPVRLTVPNDLSLYYAGGTTGDYTMPHYPADERCFPRREAKNLHAAMTAQFDILRPDMTCPSIGDYGEPTVPLKDHWLAELAWDLFGDERAARLLKEGQRRACDSFPFPEGLLTLAFGRPLPETPEFDSASVIYPHAGYAVMKSIEGDAYWGSPAIHAVLSFGPFGNGHGHADALALEIAGATRKCCVEELHRPHVDWQYWNSTVSHNTVVVGTKSQPGNDAIFETGINTCGTLVYRLFDDNLKVACAQDMEVYHQLEVYRRTVAVTDCYVADLFEVRAPEATIFDWFLHGMGELLIDGLSMHNNSFASLQEGYEYLHSIESNKTEGQLVARFSPGHTVFVPQQGLIEVFKARGPWSKDATRPTLIIRKIACEAVFMAIHDPSGDKVTSVGAYTEEARRALFEIKTTCRADRLTLPLASTTAAELAGQVSYSRQKEAL